MSFLLNRSYRHLILTFIILLTAISDLRGHGENSSLTRGVLGESTPWETNWQLLDSGNAGPTVLVVGGIHGNEPAGRAAAEQIMHWKINRGKLIVLPGVNRLGLAANTRWIPQHRNEKTLRDLNRNFPTQARPKTQTELAGLIWDFVKENKPDYVFDLHEGFDFHRLNSKSVGSSVIAFPSEKEFAAKIVQHLNQDLTSQRKFDLLAGSGPVVGSLARACHERLGAKSFIFETTTKNQPLSLRTRQHRKSVSFALMQMGMIKQPQIDVLVDQQNDSRLKIGIFDGSGAVEQKVAACFADAHQSFVAHLGPRDLTTTTLAPFDLLIFPGGSASKQGKDIGQSGREHVRKFVRDGGGLIGICAGAYLCSSHYDWSLDLANASVFNKMVDVPGKGKKSMWYRGPATSVKVQIHPDGENILGVTGIQNVRYQNGPILAPTSKEGVPNYRVLATFRSENGVYEAQKGTMIGAPAVVESKWGSGKVLAISPHFESTEGLKSVIVNAARYVARQRKK